MILVQQRSRPTRVQPHITAGRGNARAHSRTQPLSGLLHPLGSDALAPCRERGAHDESPVATAQPWGLPVYINVLTGPRCVARPFRPVHAIKVKSEPAENHLVFSHFPVCRVQPSLQSADFHPTNPFRCEGNALQASGAPSMLPLTSI